MKIDKEKQEFNFLEKLLAGRGIKFVIEIGCGDGRITKMLDEILGADITAIDADEVALEKAKKKLPKVYFKKSGFTDFFSDDKFDLMVFSMSAHHLPNFEFQYVKIVRFLKEEGYVLFIEPNIKNQISKLVLIEDPEEELRVENTAKIIKNLPWKKVVDQTLKLIWQFENLAQLNKKLFEDHDHVDEIKKILKCETDKKVELTDEINYSLFIIS